ncbi:hypothetical protein D9Q98_003627 [Chlorella vulgaris]|uniref:Uncharacterized protein n=1 Tax=Chlorella vulgaris TaxID=3077 RepID=A0A9D4TTI9_CHLVU|nr:hypothetical protein D9Q98_003627 [Chlorella vulgaris]
MGPAGSCSKAWNGAFCSIRGRRGCAKSDTFGDAHVSNQRRWLTTPANAAAFLLTVLGGDGAIYADSVPWWRPPAGVEPDQQQEQGHGPPRAGECCCSGLETSRL